MKKICLYLALFLSGCATVPEGIRPEQGFELSRYLGLWYEIARLDHSFERGLSGVTAEYLQGEDGRITVINRGYDEEKDRWKVAKGKARFGADPNTGYLQVSFFGPFYGSYVIIALDHQDYRYALVCGPGRDYLWLLARSPQLDSATRKKLLDLAEELGFPVDRLIFVDHR